jgi:hypothetical protein
MRYIEKHRVQRNQARKCQEKGEKMNYEMCDNCSVTSRLTDINYATKRNKARLLLCPKCFDNFALMIVQLVEDKRFERENKVTKPENAKKKKVKK